MKTWIWRVAHIVAVLAAMAAPAAAQSGALKVTSFPSGALVTVDGVSTGKVTPMNVSLPVGDHTVTGSLAGTGWNADRRTVTGLSEGLCSVICGLTVSPGRTRLAKAAWDLPW